ncbi:MAG: phage replisome organizer N-terminal domain-containing protein [Clostridium sp.]|uniref:phage replisome organizer N-terminal domain-containing protein n=1 Tax=Clostridium sp. TaxID=1506 RepID=UPI0029050CEA|nr:phage replisome organizer N-terminal domain-containing protein [Clostridium sp.]MDU1279173.1 phage replisome organizer N-terminal domain-containing protein [Clostridium sp.]
MAAVKWIKLNTDMFDNAKIKYLRTLPEGDKIVLIWVMLLAKAGKCNANGYIFLTENIPYTQDMLAAEFDFEITTIQLALTSLMRLGMINLDESNLYVTGWEEHQNIEGLEKIREQNRKRVAKYREKQKLLDSNVTGNDIVTESNAIDKEEERDKERDKDKEEDKEREIENICRQLSSIWTSNGYGTLNKTLLDKLLADVEIYSIEWVIKAMEIGNQRSKRTYSYLKGILENWKTEGYKEGENGSTRQDTKPSQSKWDKYQFE